MSMEQLMTLLLPTRQKYKARDTPQISKRNVVPHSQRQAQSFRRTIFGYKSDTCPDCISRTVHS